MSFFDDASLAFLPSGAAGKDGKAYSIKPTDGTGDFTFSRGSNLAATRVGADGLIEKGRENLLIQSNNFSTTWTTTIGMTLTPNQQGYDGSDNAWLVEKNANSYRRLNQNISISGVFALSVYAKAGTLDTIYLRNSATSRTEFDLANGVVGGVDESIYSIIEPVGNEWYRCTAVFNSSISSIDIYIDWGEFVAGGVYLQDAQLEIGLAATDVISTGATTGKAGLLEDEPRFDYSGGATCPSLLLEPSRTNLIKYSEYYGGSDWVRTGVTLTPNAIISPSGLLDATLVTNNVTNQKHIVPNISITDNTNYSYSVFIKKGNDDNYKLVVWNSTYSESLLGNFDFSSPQSLTITDGVTGGSYLSSDVKDFGNGWYRIELSFTSFDTSLNIRNYIGTAIGTNNATMYYYGFQLEAGSYPTSYIPNHSGGSVTRGADYFKVINQEGLFGTNEGTFFMEFAFNENNKYIGIGDTYPSDKITIGLNASGTNQIRSLIRNNGSSINLQGSDTTLGDTIKACVSYGSSGFKLFMNGSLEGSNATAANLSQFSDLIPNVDVRDTTGINSGTIKQILVFPAALSDADCIALTS